MTHGAVENEVDGVVDECRDVHDVAEGRVERREVNWLQAADQCKDALRKLNCVNSTDISVGRKRPSGTVTTVKKNPSPRSNTSGAESIVRRQRQPVIRHSRSTHLSKGKLDV